MPVYDYRCKTHGVFNELATIAEAEKPCACPTCKVLSPRIIRIAPDILDMAPNIREAHKTNELAQNEPVFSTKDRRKHDDEHASGCGCTANSKKSKLMYTARGEKMFPSMRPWMISH